MEMQHSTVCIQRKMNIPFTERWARNLHLQNLIYGWVGVWKTTKYKQYASPSFLWMYSNYCIIYPVQQFILMLLAKHNGHDQTEQWWVSSARSSLPLPGQNRIFRPDFLLAYWSLSQIPLFPCPLLGPSVQADELCPPGGLRSSAHWHCTKLKSLAPLQTVNGGKHKSSVNTLLVKKKCFLSWQRSHKSRVCL